MYVNSHLSERVLDAIGSPIRKFDVRGELDSSLSLRKTVGPSYSPKLDAVKIDDSPTSLVAPIEHHGRQEFSSWMPTHNISGCKD